MPLFFRPVPNNVLEETDEFGDIFWI